MEAVEIIFLFLVSQWVIYLQIISGIMKAEEQDCYGLLILKKNRRKHKATTQSNEQNKQYPQLQISEPIQPPSLPQATTSSLEAISEGKGKVVHATSSSKKKQEFKQVPMEKNKPNPKNMKRKSKKGLQKNKKINNILRMKSCSLKQKLSDIEQTQEEDQRELDETYKQNQRKSPRYCSDYFLVGFVRNPDQLRNRKGQGEKRVKSCIKHDIKIISESRNRQIRYTN